jgi:hypothetical protein
MRKRLHFAVAGLIALLSLASAQEKTSILVQCDQTGAGVYLNDSLVGYTSPSFSALVFPGSYGIRVLKEGFPEFKTTIIIGQYPVTIMATLGKSTPQGWPQPSQPWLFHPVTMSQLSIDSDIAGARVYLNGTFAGMTPFFSSLNPGTYSITVSYEGYEDYTYTVRLNDWYELHATLHPLPRFVDYEIKIPEYLSIKGKKPLQFSDVELYLDGKRLQSAFGKATPGNHRLALVSRDFRFENIFELVPGSFATIELFLGIAIR